MKYKIFLFTPIGVVEEIYSSADQTLESFEKKMVDKYGLFTTLHTQIID